MKEVPTVDSTDSATDSGAGSSDSDSDEELSREEIFQKFNEQYEKWMEVGTQLTLQVKSLKASLIDEKEQHTMTKAELDRQRKYNNMLSKKLTAQKKECEHPLLGGEGQKITDHCKVVTTSTTDIPAEVPELEKLNVPKGEPKLEPKEVLKHAKLKSKDTRACYSCNKTGHIQKNCGDRKYSNTNPKLGERKHVGRQHKARNYRKTEAVYRRDFREPQHICRGIPTPVYNAIQYPLQHRRKQSRFIPYQQEIRTKVCYYCNKKGHIRRNCSEFLAARRVRKYAPQTKMVWREKEKNDEYFSVESATKENLCASAEVTGSDAVTATGCHNLQTSEKNTSTSSGGAKSDIKIKQIPPQQICRIIMFILMLKFKILNSNIQGEKKSDGCCTHGEKSQMQKLLQGVLMVRLADLLAKRGRASSSSVVLPKNAKGEIVVPLKEVMAQFWSSTTQSSSAAAVDAAGVTAGRLQFQI